MVKLFAKIYNYLLLGNFSNHQTFDKMYKWKVLSFITDVVSPLSEHDKFKFTDLWNKHRFIGQLTLILLAILIIGFSIGLISNYGYVTYLDYQNEQTAQIAYDMYQDSETHKEMYYVEKDKNDSINNYLKTREWREFEIYKESKVVIPDYLPDNIFFLMDSERKKYDIPNSIYWRLIKQESDFRMVTNISSGARGYMQVMPPTFNAFRDSMELDNCEHSDRNNIRVGAYYLKSRYNKYVKKGFTDEKSWELALAAYNAGEGNVRIYDYEIPNFVETQDYVQFVYKIYKKEKEDI